MVSCVEREAMLLARTCLAVMICLIISNKSHSANTIKSPLYGSWQASTDMNLDENYHTIIATYTFERNKMTFRVTCREPSGASVSAETSSPIKFERDYVAILAEASQIVKRNESGLFAKFEASV